MDRRDEEELPISRSAGGDQILGIKETIKSGGQKKGELREREKKSEKKKPRAARQPWWSRWFRRSRPRRLSTH